MTQGDHDPAADVTSVFTSGLISGVEPDTVEEQLSGVEGLTPGTALLVVKRGPNAGSRFTLDRDQVSAGRHPESDIFLDDVSVSRRHAEFRRAAEGYEVADVGSLNGTYVNREAIESVIADQRRRGPDRQVPAGVPLRRPGGRRTRLMSRSHRNRSRCRGGRRDEPTPRNHALPPPFRAGARNDSRRPAPSPSAFLSIGAVLARLRPEFPDLSISKIRFLESEGLVTPHRTPSGYRQFSAADVERLRYVLAAQRDQYLPLRVIKDQLDAIDRGLEPATPAPRLPRSLVSADAPQPAGLAASAEVRMTRDELLVRVRSDRSATRRAGTVRIGRRRSDGALRRRRRA